MSSLVYDDLIKFRSVSRLDTTQFLDCGLIFTCVVKEVTPTGRYFFTVDLIYLSYLP